ncbi:hypothetical protein ES703_88736 [subsurface metagenome]
MADAIAIDYQAISVIVACFNILNCKEPIICIDAVAAVVAKGHILHVSIAIPATETHLSVAVC